MFEIEIDKGNGKTWIELKKEYANDREWIPIAQQLIWQNINKGDHSIALIGIIESNRFYSKIPRIMINESWKWKKHKPKPEGYRIKKNRELQELIKETQKAKTKEEKIQKLERTIAAESTNEELKTLLMLITETAKQQKYVPIFHGENILYWESFYDIKIEISLKTKYKTIRKEIRKKVKEKNLDIRKARTISNRAIQLFKHLKREIRRARVPLLKETPGTKQYAAEQARGECAAAEQKLKENGRMRRALRRETGARARNIWEIEVIEGDSPPHVTGYPHKYIRNGKRKLMSDSYVRSSQAIKVGLIWLRRNGYPV